MNTENTGIHATKNKKAVADVKDADTIWFTKEILRVDSNSEDLLSDDQLKAKCEAIAKKLNFLSDVIESRKIDGCLVAFRDKANDKVKDGIKMPKLSLDYLSA